MNLYDYKSSNNDFLILKKSVNGKVIKIELAFDTPLPGSIECNNKVFADLYMCTGFFDKINSAEKGAEDISYSLENTINAENLMVLIHGFGTKDRKLKYYSHFCRKMAENNIPCVFINLPFHLKRTPKGEKSGRRLIYYNDCGTLDFFNQSVIDIRKLLDILLSIFKTDKVSICGLSMGSMISLIAMANDPRIRKGIFLIGGGNWEEVHWNGILRFMLKGNCTKSGKMTREKCHNSYRHFKVFLEEFKKNKYQDIHPFGPEEYPLKKYTKKLCFLCDPVTFAHRINRDDVLMINSRFDLYYSRKSTIELWNELCRPKIRWINYIHSSKILTRPSIIKEIINFLKQ